jgi:hypothetical protein
MWIPDFWFLSFDLFFTKHVICLISALLFTNQSRRQVCSDESS